MSHFYYILRKNKKFWSISFYKNHATVREEKMKLSAMYLSDKIYYFTLISHQNNFLNLYF